MNWFYFVLAATLIYGFINYLFKVSAEKGYKSIQIINIQSLTVALISLTILIIKKTEINNYALLFKLAAFNSFFFALGTTLKVSALKLIPTNVVLPLNKLNSVFVIISGFILFKESVSIYQFIGIVFALLTLYLISRAGRLNHEIYSKKYFKGIIIVLAGAFSIAISMIVGKIASTSVSKMSYIFVSYCMVFVYTSIAKKILIKEEAIHKPVKEKLGLGISIGILNITGYYFLLNAYAGGPLSVVQSIFSLSMIITIILAKIIYNERLKIINIIAIILSLIAVYLMKM